MVSKYEALSSYLVATTQDSVDLSFGEIERIVGKPLPHSARTYREWWANSGQPQSKLWMTAGYRVRRPDLARAVISFVKFDQAVAMREHPQHGAMPPRINESSVFSAWSNPRSKWAVERHLNALDQAFEHYITVCDQRRIFSGPSVHFYERTIERRRRVADVSKLADDPTFHELAYAALTSWGMHRMGETVAAKLTDFAVFSSTLRKLINGVSEFGELSITELSDAQAAVVTEQLRPLVGLIGITASGAPLVANSKTLHFLLPDLVPPLDRTYTGRFFFGPNNGMLMPGQADKNFAYMFSALRRLAIRHAESLRRAAGSSYLCLGHAKGLDNSIIGYVLSHPAAFPKFGRKSGAAD